MSRSVLSAQTTYSSKEEGPKQNTESVGCMGMLLIAIFGTDFELATLRPKQGHHAPHDRRLAHI